MPDTIQPEFRRTHLTRKGKTYERTACTHCGAFQLAPKGDSCLPSWESEHLCNLAFREARSLFESAELMQQDMRRMQTSLDEMRKRLQAAE